MSPASMRPWGISSTLPDPLFFQKQPGPEAAYAASGPFVMPQRPGITPRARALLAIACRPRGKWFRRLASPARVNWEAARGSHSHGAGPACAFTWSAWGRKIPRSGNILQNLKKTDQAGGSCLRPDRAVCCESPVPAPLTCGRAPSRSGQRSPQWTGPRQRFRSGQC